jgi:hypothetical protein
MRAATDRQKSPGLTPEKKWPPSPEPLSPELKSWLDQVILPILVEDLRNVKTCDLRQVPSDLQSLDSIPAKNASSGNSANMKDGSRSGRMNMRRLRRP